MGLSNLEKRRLRGDLLALCSFLGRGSGEGGADLFSLESSDRMCGNGSKLCQGGSDSPLGSEFFMDRVVKPDDALSLSVCKGNLERPLNNLLYLWVSPEVKQWG